MCVLPLIEHFSGFCVAHCACGSIYITVNQYYICMNLMNKTRILTEDDTLWKAKVRFFSFTILPHESLAKARNQKVGQLQDGGVGGAWWWCMRQKNVDSVSWASITATKHRLTAEAETCSGKRKNNVNNKVISSYWLCLATPMF